MRSSVPDIRKIVAALRASLLSPSPEEVYSHVPALEEAAAALGQVRGDDGARAEMESGSRADIESLAQELRVCERLILQGMEVARGMGRLLAPATAAYDPDGEPAPLAAARTILVRG